MLQRIEAIIEGIFSAINNGLTEKSKGEDVVKKRRADLSETSRRIDELKGSLIRIRQQIF
jgi:hypothetical protein